MSPFDQTAKSIAKIRRDVQAGKIAPSEAEKKIRALEKKGPRFVARWTLPSGKEATKVCRTAREAKALESQKGALAKLGEHEVPKYLRAKMSEVYAYYLDNKLKGRTSYPNAKAHCRYSVEALGDITLEKLDAQADRIFLNKAYEKLIVARFPESFGSESSIFNHRTYIHSAVAYWIKMRRLRIVNPVQIWEVGKPDNVRKRTPSFVEYSRLLAVTQGPGFPAWFPVHLILGWEHGRRLGEHASLTWEGVHLNPPGEDLPWIHIRILKSGGKRESWHEIPLTYDAAKALRSIWTPGATGPVFAARVHVLADWYRKAQKKAGLTDLRFHDFRRAYRNRNDAMDRAMRMSLQGKKTTEMDDRYFTEQRRAMEPAVASTYPGDFRETKMKNEVFA
jgi:integrase